MKIFATPRFERRLKAFLYLHQDLLKITRKKMKEIAHDPFASNLKTHKLSGYLKYCFASSITRHYRIIFTVNGDELCFIDIGSHDEVY